MSKPQALLMCLSDPSRDPRPYRTIQLFNDMGMDVHIASFPVKKGIPVKKTFLIAGISYKLTDRVYRKILGALALIWPSLKWLNILNERRYGLRNLRDAILTETFDLIVVEDLYLLPVAHEIKSSALLVFDAREYYPEQLSNNLFWRFTERFNRIRICKKYLPMCDAVLTVSPGLASAYRKNFGVACHLIRSVPLYHDVAPAMVGQKIRMVHHGGAMRNRKLENMIKIFEFLDNRFELDFYLVGDSKYMEYLKDLAKPYPQIRFRDSVEFSDIGNMLSSYDVGIYLLEPTGFNVLRALPNKFFEFIQARLMLAIGPSPDMAALVQQYDCGIVADAFQANNLAEKLNSLTTDEIYAFKKSSDSAARSLCWESESKKLIEIINNLLSIKPKV